MMHQALIKKEALEVAYDHATAALRKFPRLPSGLTPDAVRAMPEWREAKKQCEQAFADLRAFNQIFVRKYGKEYREYMRGKRGAA